jgi:ABC-type multidrug transport system permease subunit
MSWSFGIGFMVGFYCGMVILAILVIAHKGGEK